MPLPAPAPSPAPVGVRTSRRVHRSGVVTVRSGAGQGPYVDPGPVVTSGAVPYGKRGEAPALLLVEILTHTKRAPGKGRGR